MPELIANRYTLQAELGRGGFATVYRALDTRLNREIALKILNPALTSDPRFIELFHREAQTAASLKHPHIVTIYDTGEFDTRLFIIMELLAGLDLRRRVTREGPLPLPLTVSIIEQIASALDYAHARGIIHRDVKAANIIVDDAGHATLTDFGLVRALESSTYGSSLSMSGGFVGSVEYIPPEMVNGEKATPLSDQYSLGVVVYEMVTGQLPFKAETPIAIAVAHSTKLPRDPRELRADLPTGVSAAILKVLAKSPTERYQDTKTFATVLRTELDRPAKETAEQEARRRLQEEQARETARRAAEAAALKAKRQQEEQEAREARKSQEQGEAARPPSPVKRGGGGEVKTPWGLILGAVGVLGALILIALLANRPTPAAPSFVVTRVVTQPAVEVTRMVTQPVAPTPLPPTATDVPTVTPVPPTATDHPTATLLPPTPTAPGFGSTQASDKDGMTLLYVPAGDFKLGAASSDTQAFDDEKPQHTVYLDAFWIDRTEVTNAMYVKCVTAGTCQAPSYSDPYEQDYYRATQFANYPMVDISWNDAQNYCQWAGGDLPTEAQWEKAARGTDGRIYPWGNQSPDKTRLIFNGNLPPDVGKIQVGAYPTGASPYGALDMAGNVWEWVRDWYSETYYASSPTRNPENTTKTGVHVMRGGGFFDDATSVRASVRAGIADGNTGIGFRCAR